MIIKRIGIFLFACVLLLSCLLLSACDSENRSDTFTANGIEAYDPNVIFTTFHSDLDSTLALFPEKNTAKRGFVSYQARISSSLLDIDGYIKLICHYEEDDFKWEVKRLSELSQELTFNEESVTKTALLNETSYAYPAYVTMDNAFDKYEYALIPENDTTIIYIYLSYPDADTIRELAPYMKTDQNAYKQEAGEGFSIYHHSFDGGKSWVEADDLIELAPELSAERSR